MQIAAEFLANNLLTLGIIVISALVIAVAYAALKHAVVLQLESKIAQLTDVLEQNTNNIAKKQRQLDEKADAFNELKSSLQDLSNRHQEMRQELQETKKTLAEAETNYQHTQQEYQKSVQSLANASKEFEQELTAQKNQFDEKNIEIQKEADKEIFNFQETYRAEFEHLKKSHKRLVKANQTMSKTVDNLHQERDFYRVEFETLRNALHGGKQPSPDSEIKNQAKVIQLPNKVKT